MKYCGDSVFGKKLSNRKVRKIDLSDGNNYKKIYSSYNIYDIIDNLYKYKKIDGIPSYRSYRYCCDKKMSVEEINKYWRK